MEIGTLSNGATVCSLSPHGFKCSDGAEIPPQLDSIVKEFTLERKFQKKGEICGMEINEVRMVLGDEQIEKLRCLAASVDLVVIPFPMLVALREQGIREQFTNCVAFNATKETQRSAPNDKVIDINNWSY